MNFSFKFKHKTSHRVGRKRCRGVRTMFVPSACDNPLPLRTNRQLAMIKFTTKTADSPTKKLSSARRASNLNQQRILAEDFSLKDMSLDTNVSEVHCKFQSLNHFNRTTTRRQNSSTRCDVNNCGTDKQDVEICTHQLDKLWCKMCSLLRWTDCL